MTQLDGVFCATISERSELVFVLHVSRRLDVVLLLGRDPVSKSSLAEAESGIPRRLRNSEIPLAPNSGQQRTKQIDALSHA